MDKGRSITSLLLLNSVHRSIAVFISVLFVSAPVSAALGRNAIKMVQMPAATSSEENRVAAEKAFAEGEQLFKQGTAESRQQAIAKYEEALKRWQSVGDRSEEAKTLASLGLVYYSLGAKQKALDLYNQSLLLRRALKDSPREAIMLLSIGGVYSDLGEKQKALDSFNQALPLSRASGDGTTTAYILTSIAQVYSDLGDQKSSLNFFNQALAIQRESQDSAGVANTLQTMGRIYLSLGEVEKALDSLNQALPLQQTLKDSGGEALTLTLIGLAYTSLGEPQKALGFYNQALPLFRAENNPIGEALALQTLGGVYNSLGERQKALDFLNQARVIYQKIGNRTGEAEILNTIGSLYDSLGEKQGSLDSYNQALSLFQAMGDRARVAFTLSNIGSVYNSLGENQKALDSYNQALSLQRAVQDQGAEATTLTYTALVYKSLGDYPRSVDSYNQALSLFRAVGDRFREAQTLDNIAGVYRLSGNLSQALDSSNQSLSLWRSQKNRFGEATTLTTLVRIYEALGNSQQALDVANQAVSLFQGMSDRSGEASAIALRGRVYRLTGDYQKALDSFNQSVSLFRAIKSRTGEASALDKIGWIYESLNEPDKAINSYNQALLLWRVLGDAGGEAETLYSIAGVESKRGNLKQALTDIEATIKIVESLRSKVTSQELRTSYFASVQKYYQFYVDLLMQLHKNNPSQGYDGKALQASEQGRARSLLEVLNEAQADIRQGVDPKLLERDRTLQQQLNIKAEKQQQAIASNKEEQAIAIKKDIDALLAQYQELQTQIRATSPRYAALTQPQPLTLSEIQQQVLDDNTLLLEYSLGDQRSYVWAVTKTGITSYELPKRADIEAAVRKFRDALTVPRLRTSPTKISASATNLSQMILAPVAQQLGQKRLVVVSDGALQYVPFAALPAPSRQGSEGNLHPLIVDHEIVNLPSASTLAIVRRDLVGRKPAPKTVAVLADPVFSKDDERLNKTQEQIPKPNVSLLATRNLELSTLERSASESGVSFDRLEFTRTEAEEILALVPAAEREQAFDFAASRAKATSPELSQYRIVHFATHGILNSTNPELSGLVLSLVNQKGEPENGFLRMHEVWNLKLPVELIVLSACQTGLGQEVKGEGIVGLTRGFMYAGAPRVVVSLWSVDDQATAELMARFYRGMLKENLKPAAALRAAQIQMWKQQQWQAPYYWAAFMVQGEWR